VEAARDRAQRPAIVTFRDGKLFDEHVHWHQASTLVQLGPLDANELIERLPLHAHTIHSESPLAPLGNATVAVVWVPPFSARAHHLRTIS
jgi:hypothetical protein